MRLQRYCSHVPLTTTQPSSIPPEFRHRKYASSGHIAVLVLALVSRYRIEKCKAILGYLERKNVRHHLR